MAREIKNQYSLLIVSASEQFNAATKKSLPTGRFHTIEIRKSASFAKRELLARRYDMVLVNAPLSDELGIDFVMDIYNKFSVSIILAIPGEIYQDITERMIDHGILTIAKPIKDNSLGRSIRLQLAFLDKLKKVQKKVDNLEEKMEELRLTDRAKLILVQNGMQEEEAHKYIIRQAMDKGMTKRAVAEDIIESA